MEPGAQQVLSKRLFNGQVGGRCPQFSLDMLLFSLCPLGDPAWPVSVTVVVQEGPYGSRGALGRPFSPGVALSRQGPAGQGKQRRGQQAWARQSPRTQLEALVSSVHGFVFFTP